MGTEQTNFSYISLFKTMIIGLLKTRTQPTKILNHYVCSSMLTIIKNKSITSCSMGVYILRRISCRSFWIQNGLWAISGWSVINKTVLGVFWKNGNSEFFWKHPKLFCLYLSNQITLRSRFVFKTNGRISSITSYKDHCCSFFTSWVIKKKWYFDNFEKKTPNFGRAVRTLDGA